MASLVEPEFVDSNHAAEILGVKPQALAYMRHKRIGPPFQRLGPRLVRYHVPTIRKWLLDRTGAAPESLKSEGR